MKRLANIIHFSIIAFLIFSLFAPEITLKSRKESKFKILIDLSKSLKPVEQDLKKIIKKIKNLDINFEIVAFGDKVREFKEVKCEDKHTDISSALLFAHDSQGILLITDGFFNTGENPLKVCRKLNIPVSVLAIGKTPQKIELSKIIAPEELFADEKAKISVFLKNKEKSPIKLNLILFINDKKIKEKKLELKPYEEKEEKFDLSFSSVGLKKVKITADYGKEKVTAIRLLKVKEPRKILFIADKPSWNFKFLKINLEKERGIKFDYKVKLSREKIFQKITSKDYDLLICDRKDIDANILKLAQKFLFIGKCNRSLSPFVFSDKKIEGNLKCEFMGKEIEINTAEDIQFLKPMTKVYARIKGIKKVFGELPLIASYKYKDKEIFHISTEEAWKLEFPFKLISNFIIKEVLKEKKKLLCFYPKEINPGEEFTLIVRTLAQKAFIEIDGKRYRMVKSGENFVFSYTPENYGKKHFKITTEDGTYEGEFWVKEPRKEEPAGINRPLLQKIAKITGGEYSESEIKFRLKETKIKKKLEFFEKRWILILLLSLLLLEWTILRFCKTT